MKHNGLIGLLLMFSISAFCQNEMKDINKIKSNKNYLYAIGASTKSIEEATANAESLISMEIEQWLKEKKIAGEELSGYMAKSNESYQQIRTRRGKIERVFIYVKKKDILPIYNEENSLIVDFNAPSTEQQIDTLTKQVVDVKTQIPDTIKTIQREIVASEIEKQPVLNAKEINLLNIKTMTGMEDYIRDGLATKEILSYGPVKTIPKKGVFYIVIVNYDTKSVVAYLKKTDEKTINLVSMKPDDFANYPGNKAVYIELNNKEK